METTTKPQNAEKETIKDKRKFLSGISKGIKKLVEVGEFNSVNEGLLAFYSDDLPEGTEFESYRGWRKKGYQVKKGEKAFLLWGSPRKAKSKKEESDEDEFKFFPLAYVFSSEQVEPYEK